MSDDNLKTENDYTAPDLLGALARAVKAAKEDEQTMAQVRATIASKAEPQTEFDHTPTADQRELLERMHADAVANGDYQGAAELAALLNDQETR